MAVAKVLELIGGSEKGFDDALNQIIKRANKTVRNLTGLEIISQKVKINKDKSLEYRVKAKVLFLIENNK
ncbi:MAG: dodecin family protein [Candidatus Nanoarchaeia archaeon]|nr:dodecin family protein [Candidatus Nanoarchaeia archaeon]MDD5054361.1 dodecin family protein [Candidatus Nanoarchaeia archaeon]MDD5499707.1 dodecin family protein [Candidatus Nanoarchaeia archaeon]